MMRKLQCGGLMGDSTVPHIEIAGRDDRYTRGLFSPEATAGTAQGSTVEIPGHPVPRDAARAQGPAVGIQCSMPVWISGRTLLSTAEVML